MNEGLQLLAGGLLLYFGAEWFVAGASALALALRVPQILVGLTNVAYATSAPEIIVGVQAASVGHNAVALGNFIARTSPTSASFSAWRRSCGQPTCMERCVAASCPCCWRALRSCRCWCSTTS